MKILKNLLKYKGSVIVFILTFNLILASSLVVKAEFVNTPADKNAFQIVSTEEAGALAGCEITAMSGYIPGALKAAEKIFSRSYTDDACDIVKAAETTALDDPRFVTAMQEHFAEVDNANGLGILSSANSAILAQRPLSTVKYIEDKVYALTNPGGTVYATGVGGEPASYFPGVGFDLLRPIQAFWGWSVNIVYGFLILLIIMVAFGIIFRSNLGGAQVVTLQSAIPSIAMAMILVPLSYAISGVFIDVITVGTNAVHDFLMGPGAPGRSVYEERNVGLECDPTTAEDCDRGLYADDTRVDWFNARERIDLREQGTAIGQSIGDGTGLTNIELFNMISNLLNTLFNTGGGWESVAWFGAIINFAISILTIWIGIKIFIKLFGKYLLLILMPIMSPFIFASAAIPGNGTKSIVSYLKLMASGSLFFIVTYAMFLLTFIFTSPTFQAGIPDLRTSGFVPPLLSLQYILNGAGASLSGAGNGSITGLVFTLIGLGIYYSIPKTLENLDNTLGTNNPLPDFIKTPIDSFRESWKITTKSAPAVFGRGVSVLGGGLREAARTPINLRRSYMDFYNRRRGIDANNPLSAQSQLGSELATRKAELERQRQQAILNKNGGEARRLSSEIAKIDTKAKDLGAITSYAKPEDEPTLKATFKWKDGKSPENMIIFNTADADSLISRATSGGVISLMTGGLVLEAMGQGNILPEYVDVVVGSAKELSSTQFIFDAPVSVPNPDTGSSDVNPLEQAKAASGSLKGALIFGNSEKPGSPATPTPLISLHIGRVSSTTFKTSQKSVEIPVELRIDSTFVPTLFGTKSGNVYSGGEIDATQIIQFQRRAFRVGNSKSNVIKVIVKYAQ
jgi:hypothetical protein